MSALFFGWICFKHFNLFLFYFILLHLILIILHFCCLVECVGLSRIPEGTWYCRYCHNMFEKEKSAENDANAIAAGRVHGVDPIAEISQRCIRIIGTVHTEVGGCAVCRFSIFTSFLLSCTSLYMDWMQNFSC